MDIGSGTNTELELGGALPLNFLPCGANRLAAEMVP